MRIAALKQQCPLKDVVYNLGLLFRNLPAPLFLLVDLHAAFPEPGEPYKIDLLLEALPDRSDLEGNVFHRGWGS